MRRETDAENRKSVGKTSLAFMDLENMSTELRLVFLVAAICLFGILGYIFYKELFVEKEDPSKARRQKINEKRAAKNKVE